MHERYLYPLFAPLLVLVAEGKSSLWLYGLLSLIYGFNLYQLWWYPSFSWLKGVLLAGDFFLARFFSLVLLLLFFWLAYNRINEKAG